MFSSISLFPHFLVTLQWVRRDSQWNRRIFIKNCEISVRCFDPLSFVWENGQCRFVSFLSYLKSYLEELSAFLEKGKWIFHRKPRLEKLSQLWNFSQYVPACIFPCIVLFSNTNHYMPSYSGVILLLLTNKYASITSNFLVERTNNVSLAACYWMIKYRISWFIRICL